MLGARAFEFVYSCWLFSSLVSFSANPLTIQRSAVSSFTVYIFPARSKSPLYIVCTFIFTVIFFSITIRTPFGMISLLYTRFWGGGKGVLSNRSCQVLVGGFKRPNFIIV